jgi:small-conductance mechanosensitive channel
MAMSSLSRIWEPVGRFLGTGIGGSSFTPLGLIVVVTMIAALVWLTKRATHWFVDRVLARRGFDLGMREALGTIARYTIITLGTLVILQSAGIDLTSLNVLVGAVGVGLGFGLQNITSNFFSGLILLFERPIRIGDRIGIGEVVGEVRSIGARATVIVTDDSVAAIVPNSQFVSERVTNWSRPGALTAYALVFFVSHDSDPELVRQVLLAAADAHAGVLEDPAPEVEFMAVERRALRFQLQVWSKVHMKTAGTLRSELNFAVWRQLAAAGVAIRNRRTDVGVAVRSPA